METNKVKQIYSFGQSIWLDFIDRTIISSGNLKKLINEDGISGVTSNPSIFEKAISVTRCFDFNCPCFIFCSNSLVYYSTKL